MLINGNGKMKQKRLSPYSKEFWIEKKGFSEEEAIFKANSIRPIRKEYWMVRGYLEEDAIKLAKDTKDNNNKKGAKASGSRPLEEIKSKSPRCIESWLLKGYSKEEAVQKVKETQATFSLDKMIEKHGFVEGTKRWQKRQDKWQNTLKSKSEDEIIKINKKKSSVFLHGDIEECVKKYNTTKNMNLVATVEDFIEKVKKDLQENPNKAYLPLQKYIKQIPKIQLDILEELKYDINEIQPYFKDSSLVRKIEKQSYRKWVDEKYLLRSSYEIYFYEKLIEMYPDVEVFIDQRYPDSNMRYDFKIKNEYIEICPTIHTIEKTAEKMRKKKELFGCILLSSIKEIDEYLRDDVCKLL